MFLEVLVADEEGGCVVFRRLPNESYYRGQEEKGDYDVTGGG